MSSNPPKPRNLKQWLAYQERLHIASIELGLERVREVWQRLGRPRPAPEVITVGGTNGKGSTVALLEGLLRARGLAVGCYTSPHLQRYNERIRIAGQELDDAALIAAFEQIEQARGATPLTYFEFGTLAALELLARAKLDVAVLEVGLGGRLDAVNLIDADLAIITTIDLDHQDWLGSNRDAIGREKAAIARAGRPVILGEPEPPAGLLQALATLGADAWQLNKDFWIEPRQQGWRWRHRDGSEWELPPLALEAPVQYHNAAAALAALHARDQRRAVSVPPWLAAAALAKALREVRLPGRLQHLGGRPELVLDVAHNPQAAQALAEWLASHPARTVHAVYGSLADKDVGGVIAALRGRIAHWHLASLDRLSRRGLSATALVSVLRAQAPAVPYDSHPDPLAALAAARAATPAEGLILAFGSFWVAGELLPSAPLPDASPREDFASAGIWL